MCETGDSPVEEDAAECERRQLVGERPKEAGAVGMHSGSTA